MILDGRTLILVADDRRGRLFEEARRGGPLIERPDWIGSQGGTVHVSHPNGCDRADLTASAEDIQQTVRPLRRVNA